MDKNMDIEELQTRRQFFKKASQKVLPMIGAFIAAPTIISTTLTSCSCDGCEAACMDDCQSTCGFDCANSCSSSSYNSSIEDDDCANNCSSSCKSTCSTACDSTCKETCKSTCEGSATGKPTKGTINGHEYVDLGLSVLWATCNIGANRPEEEGDDLPFVFADRNYTEGDYYSERDFYNSFVGLNLKPEDSISGTYLDTAKKRWGDKWRMPSKDELKELSDNCRGNYSSKGIEIVSKINGNSIFIPWYGGDYDIAILWSSTIAKKTSTSKSEEIYAYVLHEVKRGESFENNVFIDVHEHKITGYGVYEYAGYLYTVIKQKIRPVADKDSSLYNCNNSCTANCSSDCSETCKNECSGTCKGSCGNDCTGGCKTTCNTGCYTKCTKTCADSCSANCTGKCTATCADSCKAQTSQTCSYCSNNCSSECTETCASECKAQSSQGCSNCATQCTGNCNNTCTYGCGRGCSTSCGGRCSGKCGASCQVECIGVAKLSYCASCGRTCTSSCNENCTYDCYTTCKSVGYK